MAIERKTKSAAARLGHEVIESQLPTEDPVLAGLRREARELSDSTFVVPLRIEADSLGNVVNDIRDSVFAHGVVLPVSGPETGHAVPQVGPGEVFANPNLVVDGSFGDGVGMTINRMHQLEAAAAKFVPLARDEYRLEAMHNFLELTGQSSVYDPQSETHLNAGQIGARLADLEVSYQTHFDTFYEDVTGKKVEKPKTAKERKRTRIMAPPVRIVDENPHEVRVPEAIEAWFKEINWKKVGLVATGALAALGPACAAATPIAPTPIQFVTPTEVSPTATTPPTVEAATATTAPTETAVPPTKTPEPTATQETAEGVAAKSEFYREERTYSYVEVDGVKYVRDEYTQGLVQKYVEGQGWVDTSWEEKAGHLAPVDEDYELRIYKDPGRGWEFWNIPAYWTGYYETETVLVEGTDMTTETVRHYYVTRNSSGELVVLEYFTSGLLGSGEGILLKLVSENAGGREGDINGGFHNYASVARIELRWKDIAEVLRVLSEHKAPLAGVRGEASIGEVLSSSKANKEGKERREDFVRTAACILDPNIGAWRWDCHAAVARQVWSREVEFPLIWGDELAAAIEQGGVDGVVKIYDVWQSVALVVPIDGLDTPWEEIQRELEALKHIPSFPEQEAP